MTKKIIVYSTLFFYTLLSTSAVDADRHRFTRTDTDEPVVLDNATGLVWQGCPAGLTDSNCRSGSLETRNWQPTLFSYCESLEWGGYNDWRMPNVKELASIVDDRNYHPAINLVAFPATPNMYFWSSTSYVGSTSKAWAVDFGSGYTSPPDKISLYAFRCVRISP